MTKYKRRANSGNFNKSMHSGMRAVGVPCKKPASAFENKRGRWHEKFSVCPTAKDRKTNWKCCQCSGCMCKDHSVETI
jgi:hypothetical protein